MTTTVSSLMVEVRANVSGLTKGLRKGDREVQGFAGSMRQVGRDLTGLGAQFTPFTARIGLALGAGIAIASDFQDTLTELSARTGIVGNDLEDIADFALEMGAKTAFSAQQAADALLGLTASGFSASEAMAALPGIMDAAAAGGVELAYASDAITNVMSAFGLVDPADAGLVADALVAAAGASKADFSDLAEAFTNLGSIPTNFGMDVRETAAALAVLAGSGLKGAEAGTALKSMLLNFTTDTAQQAFHDLGVDLYDSTGNARDFDSVLDDLAEALKDKTPEEQAKLMKDLGGSYGLVALGSLLGAGGINTMQLAMDEQASAADVASARTNTFSGKLDALKGSVETLAIKALTPLMEETLTPLVEKITDAVNAVSDWAEENPELANTLILIAGAALLLGPGMALLGVGIQAAGVAFGALGTVVGVVGLPILALAGAIALLIGVLNDPRIQEGLKAWEGVFDQIKTIGNHVFNEVIKPAIDGVITTLQNIWISVMDGLNAFNTGVSTSFQWVVDNVFTPIGDAIGGFIGTLSGLWDSVSAGIATFTEQMSIAFTWIKVNVIDPIKAAIDGVANALNTLMSGLGAYGGAASNLGAALNSGASPGDIIGALIGAIGDEINPPGALGGANILGDGLVYAHAGERILNPAETRDYERGGGGGRAVQVNLTSYGSYPHELLQIIEQALREKGY